MNKPKAILFDWDGTLADTRGAVVSCMEKILAAYGKEPWEATKRKYRDNNKSIKENFPNFFGAEAKEAYQRYLSCYSEFGMPLVHIVDGAVRFLTLCEENNILLFITSSKEKSLLVKEVKSLLPEFHFKKIFGDGDTPYNKPHADPVFAALQDEDFEINASNVWLIGDSTQDTGCAVNAGICPVLINNKTVMWDEDDEIATDKNGIVSVSSFDELSRLLERCI